jgi:Ca2+-transporting ATPase
MLIDPICSIVLEAEPAESDVMRRPPRRRDEPILAARTLLWSIVQGGGALAAILALYGVASLEGLPADQARGLAFTALVVADLLLVLVNRAWGTRAFRGFLRPNASLLIVVLMALVALGLTLFVPELAHLFRFGTPEPGWLLVACGVGMASVAWFELMKPLRFGR